MSTNLKQEELMLSKGYAPVRLVADKMQVHFSTVYRLIESEKVKGLKVGSKQFVLIQSVIDYLGPEVAGILGMIKAKK